MGVTATRPRASGDVGAAFRRTGVTRTADLAVAVGLAAIAGVMRGPALAPSSLWLDDAWVALASRAPGLDSLLVVPTAKGFAALLGAWFDAVGFSELRAQLLPFVFGVAGPAVLYLVAVRACRLPRAAGFLAAAVLVAAPVHVEYSTRVKQFTLDALMVALVLGAGWRVIERPDDRRRWWALAALGLGVLIMSSATAPVTVAALVAGTVAGGWRAGRAATATWAGGAFLFWAFVLRDSVTGDLREYWQRAYLPRGADWPDRLWDQLAALLDGAAAVPPWLSGAVLVAAVVALAVRRPALAVLLLGPLVIAVGLATAELAPLGGGRTDVWLYPALALTVAAAVPWRVGGRPVAIAAAAVAAVLLLAAPSAGPYPPEDVRPLIGAMEDERRSGDAVVLYPATRFAYSLYTPASVTLHESGEASGFSAVVHDPALAFAPAVPVGAERLWLLATHWRSDLAEVRLALHEAGWASLRIDERPGARLELWERRR